MAKSSKYGVFQRFKPSDLRRDTRSFFELYKELLTGSHGIYFMMGILCLYAVVLVMLPFGGEIFAVLTYFYLKKYTHPNEYLFEWPFRAPMHSDSMDATTDITAMVSDEILGDPKLFLEYARNKREKLRGEGVTYHGRCQDTGNPVYSSNSDDRTHSIVLGTTGSGKTEYMLSNCANQHVQNSGYIFVDAKGDTKAQQDHFRLCNRFGRVEDLLTINFITSGRNMLRAQTDKMTNSMNQMSNTSSGMLIEFLINLLDDSGGGGGDMWKGRAIAFIEMWTRVLVYLRDSGFIKLAPNELAQYVGLEDLEELVFNHQGKYGQDFERVAEQLQGYILSLPCYSTDPIDFKKQKDITREQHGFITMKLTKFIDDLTFSYGHILGKAEAEATATETTSLREYILMHHYDIGDRSVHFSGEGLTIQEVKDLAVYIQFKAENLLSDTVSLSNITIAQFLETHGAKILKENVLSLIGFNPLGMILIDMYEERESRICGNNWYAENYEAFDSKYGEAASTFLKAKSEGKNLDGALI